MEIKGKKITVVGLQKTGLALAGFLSKRGATVKVTDRSDEKKLGEFAVKAKALGIEIETGGHSEESFTEADFIILSPGVPHYLTHLEKARQKGIPVIGEIELASQFIDCPVIAITGTNGKSTATELAGDMLRKSGFRVFVGGNIGTPLISCIDLPDKPDFVVAEISSFQLDTCVTFRPKAAVLLNITEDHLDRYGDMDDYADSKMIIFRNQKKNDFAVINAADSLTMRRVGKINSQKAFFNEKTAAAYSAVFEKDRLVLRSPEKGETAINTAGFRLKGIHNLENLAASALATWLAGASMEGIQESVDTFKGLPHRVEFCGEISGVSFYDDSKATNIDAVLRAVEGFDEPLAIIMGGRDKGATFEIMIDALKKNTVIAVLIGEASEKINRAFTGHIDTVFAENMDYAVRKGFDAVKKTGGAVLLSPACASFDMFTSYSHRGRVFVECAEKLIMDTGRNG